LTGLEIGFYPKYFSLIHDKVSPFMSDFAICFCLPPTPGEMLAYLHTPLCPGWIVAVLPLMLSGVPPALLLVLSPNVGTITSGF
jgi:hypothetical protein